MRFWIKFEVWNPLSTSVSQFHRHFIGFTCIALFFDYLWKKTAIWIHTSINNAVIYTSLTVSITFLTIHTPMLYTVNSSRFLCKCSTFSYLTFKLLQLCLHDNENSLRSSSCVGCPHVQCGMQKCSAAVLLSMHGPIVLHSSFTFLQALFHYWL